MIDSLLTKSEESITDEEAKYWENKYDMNAIQDFDESELMDAESVLDNMTDEEMAQMYDEIVASEQAEYNPTLEDVKNIDPKDELYSNKIYDALERQKQALIQFSKESSGAFIIPPSVLVKVIEGIQAAVKLGATFEQALRDYASKNNLKVEDIEESLYTVSEYQQRKSRERITGEKINAKESKESKEAKEISKKVTKKITVNEKTALKDQIKLEAKAAIDGAKSVTTAIKEITKHFNSLAGKDKLSRKDLTKIINLISKVKDTKTLNDAIPKLFDIVDNANENIIEINEMTALKDQIKLENKAGKSVRAQQQALMDSIRELAKKGNITVRQAKALMNKIKKVNLDKESAVNDLLKYAEKVFNDADYAEKLANAKKIRKSALRKVKNPDKNQAQVIGVTKAFGKINVDNVADLNEYIEIANKLNQATKPSRIVGEEVVFKDATSIDEVNEYIDRETERQDKEQQKMLLEEYKDLVDSGVINDSMSLKEMQEYIAAISSEDADTKIAENEKKNEVVRAYTKAAFESKIAWVNDKIDNDDTISLEDKAIMKKALDVDIDRLGTKEAFKFVDALNNFLVNDITSGVEGMIEDYQGALSADKLNNSGLRSKEIKLFGSEWYGQFRSKQSFSLPVLFDFMFKGESGALKFMKASGLSRFVAGKVKALKTHDAVLALHKKMFAKTEPNGKHFNNAENINERGIYAYLLRSSGDTELSRKEMFNQRVDNVKNTIENHRNSKSKKRALLADNIEKVAEKLGLFEDNVTIESVSENVDEINKKDVDFWINTWANIYGNLSDVSLSVYNTELSRDSFYTTDTITGGSDAFLMDDNVSSFSNGIPRIDSSKTGVLKENNRHKVTKQSNTVIDFNFDFNQDRAFKNALIDIETAAPIRHLKSFMNSPALKEIVATEEDLNILKERLSNYVKRTKGKAVSIDELRQSEKMMKLMNRYALYNTSLVLGRPSQYLLQTAPIIGNTMFNSKGRFDIVDAMSPSAIRFLARTNRTISIRSKEALTHIEKAEKYLKSKPDGTLSWIPEGFDKMNEFWLKYTLEKADVWVANASWLSYYQEHLHTKKGVDTGKIDWDSHKVDEDAADYAQHKVDRQQNISDPHQAGEWQQSPDTFKKVMTKMIAPFSSFGMNQKGRMHADIRSMMYGTEEDRSIAMFSLFGLITEQLIFRSIQAGIETGLYSLGASIYGYNDDDEEKEKIKERFIKNAAKQGFSDMLSPHPTADAITITAINMLSEYSSTVRNFFSNNKELEDAVKFEKEMRKVNNKPEMGEKEEYAFREKFVNENIWQLDDYVSEDKLGMFGIAIGKGNKLKDLAKKVFLDNGFLVENKMTGEKTRKFLIPEDRDRLKSVLYSDAAYMTRLVPSEVNTMLNNQDKFITKRALSAKQYDNYEQIKKEYKKDLSANFRYDLIQSNKSINSIMNGIQMFDDYNMTDKKYDDFKAAKKIAKDKKISWDDESLSYFILDELKAGRKPSQIKFD
jgi:hypothetical protein